MENIQNTQNKKNVYGHCAWSKQEANLFASEVRLHLQKEKGIDSELFPLIDSFVIKHEIALTDNLKDAYICISLLPATINIVISLGTMKNTAYSAIISNYLTNINEKSTGGTFLIHDKNDISYKYIYYVPHRNFCFDGMAYFLDSYNLCIFSATNRFNDIQRLCKGEFTKEEKLDILKDTKEMVAVISNLEK